MIKKTPVAICISGRGSNMKALVEACDAPDFPARIVCVFSDKEQAAGLDYARKQGITVCTLARKGFSSREAYDTAVAGVIAEAGAELVCFAGYMRLVTPAFISRWPDKILNVHPSLLPSFKGMDAQVQALGFGVKIAGCTVHIVREDMDAGPIIIQRAVDVREGDTPDTLSARITQQEHIAYVQALRLVCEGNVVIEGNRTVITQKAIT